MTVTLPLSVLYMYRNDTTVTHEGHITDTMRASS
jgi:hypothetical protein